MLRFLGLQDTWRKRTTQSCESWEWVATSVDSSNGAFTVFVSVKKCVRNKEMILRILQDLREGGGLDFKELESNREYLVYICRT